MSGRTIEAPESGRTTASAEAIEFADIWEHRQELVDICQRIVGDPALADDVVQETYLLALRNIDRLEKRDGLMPWLVTVAKRRSLNELRRQKYATVVDEVPERTTSAEFDPSEVVSITDEVQRVQGVLELLSPRERDLLMKQVYGGLTLQQLAMAEDSTPASVRSVLNRARTKIRAALTETGVAVVAPLAAFGRWARRRYADLRLRPPLEPAAPAATSHRVAEIAVAGIASLTLGVTSGVVPFPGQGGADAATTVEAAQAPGGPANSDVAGPAAAAGATEALAVARIEPGTATGGEGATNQTIGRRPGTGGSAGGPGGPSPTGGPGAVPGTPEAPAPNGDDLPVNPDNPFPKADEPSEASYHHFSTPTQGEPQATPDGEPGEPGAQGAQGAQGGASAGADEEPVYVFALGTTRGKCTVGCTALFASEDGGKTWEAREARHLNGDRLLVAPNYPEDPRIFATGPLGLQISTNGGNTFEQVVTAAHRGPATMAPGFSTGDERIVIGASRAAWEYDASADMSHPASNAPESTGVSTFAFSADHAESGLMYVGSIVADHERTTATVHRCRGKVRDLACSEAFTLDGLTDAPKLYSPTSLDSSKVVFAWGEGMLYRSVDRARNFEAVELPFSNLTALTDRDGVVYASGYTSGSRGVVGGVAASHDGGETWTTLGAGTALADGVASVAALGDDRLVAAPLASAGGGILCSDDGGKTWREACEAG